MGRIQGEEGEVAGDFGGSGAVGIDDGVGLAGPGGASGLSWVGDAVGGLDGVDVVIADTAGGAENTVWTDDIIVVFDNIVGAGGLRKRRKRPWRSSPKS